jgi:single-strand DNA-binding protein
MADETLITVRGNAVDDVQLRFTQGGAAVASFRIASTARKYDKNSNSWVNEEPTFLTVNVWRQQAEQVAESVAKGTRVVVFGQLKQRSYEKDGQKRTVFEIEAEEVAVSLRFATAKVTKVQRSGNGQQPGGGQRQAQQGPWGQGGAQSSGWGQQGGPPGGGWGAQGGSPQEPPF